MISILIIIIGIVVIIAFIFWLAKKEADKHGTSMEEEFIGICATPLGSTVAKRANLDRIIKLFDRDEELTNEEIRGELKLSSRTAIRYMDELEKQGKVRQVGKIGRYTKYRLR